MTGSCSTCERHGRIRRGRCDTCYSRWYKHRTPEQRRRPTAEERFWAKVDRRGPEECWPWTGARRVSGHGIFSLPRRGGPARHIPAARYSRELNTGDLCPPGLHALHHCDFPPCVNPAHVYFGTPADNAEDRVARGREPRGAQRPNAKLTPGKVVALRTRFAAGEAMGPLAAEFGIGTALLSRVVNGLEWRQVGGPRTSRRDQRGTTKARDIRKGCLKEAVLLTLRSQGEGSWRAHEVAALLEAETDIRVSLSVLRTALGGLASRGHLARLEPGVYRVASTSERAADDLHARTAS